MTPITTTAVAALTYLIVGGGVAASRHDIDEPAAGEVLRTVLAWPTRLIRR